MLSILQTAIPLIKLFTPKYTYFYFLTVNPLIMRSIVLSFIAMFAISILVSCSRSITVEQAANGKARCGKNYLR